MSAPTSKAIDLFAGLGGFTEAATAAGLRVLWAANHWRPAVEVHAANHPGTLHVCQDLHQADWEQVPRMDVVLASPACQGHSKARGADRPHHDATRSTAWAVVSCVEFHRPALVIIENVPEFLQWTLYPAWREAMRSLGYAIGEHVFDAADAGVPQNRKRMFLVGTRSRSPLILPAPGRAHVPVADLIDWRGGRWSQVHRKGRAANTLERIRHGRQHFGERFVISYYGNTKTARSVDRPVGTITTRDRWAAVDGDRMRIFSVDECRRAMGFRDSYILPRDRKLAIHLLGNAVPPGLAEYVIREAGRAA